MVETRTGKVTHLVILAALGLCSVGLGIKHISAPINTTSKAPQAVHAAPHVEPTKTDANGVVIPTKKPNLNGRISVSDVHQTFAQIGYDLDPVLEGSIAVPRLFLSSLPYDLSKIQQTAERKSVFFRTLLPLVLKINEEIVENRKRVWQLRHRVEMSQELLSADRIWLDIKFKEYRVTYGDFDKLLTRMDIVPPSLALAQAAEESGWGTSRFAREGNALFGQWTFNPKDKGIVPDGRAEGKTHRIRAFDTLKDSLRAYVRNLNTHKAYGALRVKRNQMRKDRLQVNGFDLATALTKYSERGEHYVTSLQAIISKNDLRRYDKTKLDESAVGDLNGPLI